jgi:hypothetical protein
MMVVVVGVESFCDFEGQVRVIVFLLAAAVIPERRDSLS